MTGPDVFAAAKEESRCPDVHEALGRCGLCRGHQGACAVAVPEGKQLVMHLWRQDGEVRRVEPGWWGMSRTPVPWAPGYTFPPV